MLRRSHKKSRGGCLECKRRHIKCDKFRPVCSLCRVSERSCTYDVAVELRDESVAPATSSSEALAASTSANPASGNASSGSGASMGLDRALDDAINMDHMELLIHLLTERNVISSSADPQTIFDHAVLALKESVSAPYLLYELLALSAQHLAAMAPPASAVAARRLRQAIVLQTQALTHFNAAGWRGRGGRGDADANVVTDDTTNTNADSDARDASDAIAINSRNCVALLLFASVLGQHLLSDSLTRRDGGGLDAFLAHYVQSAQTQRGVNTIVTVARPLLLQSPLGPTVLQSKQFTSRQPWGSDCQLARLLVENSSQAGRLSPQERDACFSAIRYLQVGFDAMSLAGVGMSGVSGTSKASGASGACAGDRRAEGHPSPDVDTATITANRHKMTLQWSVLVPETYHTMLAAKRPEALAILAYYALLLHYSSDMWQVGHAGRFVLGLVEEYLGPSWSPWLAYPRERILQHGSYAENG